MFYPTFPEEYSHWSQWELRADVPGQSLEYFSELSLWISQGNPPPGWLAKHRCSSGGDADSFAYTWRNRLCLHSNGKRLEHVKPHGSKWRYLSSVQAGAQTP